MKIPEGVGVWCLVGGVSKYSFLISRGSHHPIDQRPLECPHRHLGTFRAVQWWGLPTGCGGEEPTCQRRRHKRRGSVPGSGRSPGAGNGTQSSVLAWEVPWTEEPGGLQSTGLQRAGHDWAQMHTWPSSLFPASHICSSAATDSTVLRNQGACVCVSRGSRLECEEGSLTGRRKHVGSPLQVRRPHRGVRCSAFRRADSHTWPCDPLLLREASPPLPGPGRSRFIFFFLPFFWTALRLLFFCLTAKNNKNLTQRQYKTTLAIYS